MDKSLDEAQKIYNNNIMLQKAIIKDNLNKYKERVNLWFFSFCESLKDDEELWRKQFEDIYEGVCLGHIDKDKILLRSQGDDQLQFDWQLIDLIRSETFIITPFRYHLEKKGHILNNYEIRLDIYTTGGGLFKDDPQLESHVGIFAIKANSLCAIF